VTSVSPPGRYGVLDIDEKNVVKGFVEKPMNTNQYINGGFMIFEKEVLELVKSDADTLEESVLSKLAQENELMAFKHSGFWQSMDTLRDKRVLEELIAAGNAPWL
jgi:glucose-1-phosphate cytidylyltransferase